MFRPPSADLSDYTHYANWVEACTLFSGTGFTSKSKAADVLRDEGIIGSRADDFFEVDANPLEDSFSDEDSAGTFLEEVWQTHQQRRLTLKRLYPFLLTHQDLRLSDTNWKEVPTYSTLLLADLWRMYHKPETLATETFPVLFEKIVEASKKGLLGGAVVRFGHPPDENWPTGINERIQLLGELMSLKTESLEGKTAAADNDRGLDVAGRLGFGDDGAGTIVVLTQCATGKHWRKKTGEPSLSQWRNIFQWDAKLIRGVAIPWSLSPEERIRTHHTFDDAVVFDRFRLLYGDPDAHLTETVREEMIEWCTARLSELPSLS